MTTYILLHSLTPWLMPPGLQILLGLLGIIIYSGWRKLGILLMAAGIFSLWLASMPVVAYNLIEILQNRYPVLQLTSFASQPFSHGVIVVLGSGTGVNIEKNNQYTISETTLNRLHYAAWLHRQMHLPILVSGGRDRGAAASEADLMMKVLQEDYQIQTVLKEDESLTTADEARLLVPILKQHHIDGIYLVTNAWHMPRSVASFTRAHIRVIPAPMGYQVYDHHYTLLSYVPNIQALHTTTIALHEWIGLLWYRLNNK